MKKPGAGWVPPAGVPGGEEKGRGAAGSGAGGMRGGRATAAQGRGAGLGDGR